MTKQVQFYPLGGGLDIVTPAIAARPGTARAALNYESDAAGYRRMTGYERFDGQTSPTDAYDAAPDIVTGAVDREAARAAIAKPAGSGPIRGVWYFNGDTYCFRDTAASTEMIGNTTFSSGTGWNPFGGASISGGAVHLSTTNAAGVENDWTGTNTITGPFDAGYTYELILVVTQLGDCSPHALAGDTVNGTTANLDQPMTLGTNTFRFAVPIQGNIPVIRLQNFAGGTTEAIIDSISLKRTAFGGMYKATNTGWQEVSHAFAAGGLYEFVNYNFTGAASQVKMFGVNGVGKAFQFDGTTVIFITTGMAPDTPFKIEAHKRHLFLAFPGGSLQHSALGDPLTWTAVTGAAELALGDEITNLVSAAPTNLVVTSKGSVTLLYGSDASDWQLETLTNEAGALPFTAERLGPVIYMDNRGLRSLTTTPSFGNFNLGTITLHIAPLLRAKLAAGQLPVAACRVRGRDIYRVFFGDGTGLSVYVGRKQPEVMPIDLATAITCVCSAETEDTSEKIWFGTEDGWVHQMDRGRSYDGEALEYHLRLPFNHMGGPQLLKRWHKSVLEYDAATAITMRIAGEVDYADPLEPPLGEQNVGAPGGGGFWDAVNWDQFIWSAPVEGKVDVYIDAIGQSMSLLIGGEQADEEPHVLQGLTLFFSVRGMKR